MSKLEPESSYLVTVSDAGVSVTTPDGEIQSVDWDDLQSVAIETNDLGPFVADVFWHLFGSKSKCIIPRGATGEKMLVARLQTLPDFNNEALIEAMSSTTNQVF